MTSDYLKGSRNLEEVYALIDENRVAAAKAAHAKFHNDMEAAIATIVSIGSIASARVMADSRVASAKVLINAELTASRLLAEAQTQASKYANEVLTKPKEVVEAALLEIGRNTTEKLVASAKESVEKIQADAEDAIKVLRDTGAIAIREIQTLATDAAEQTKRDAELAAEKLSEYRKSARAPHEAAADEESVAQIVIKAAQEASLQLQETMKVTLAKINEITDGACMALHEAALAAEKKIYEGRELALARLEEALQAHL